MARTGRGFPAHVIIKTKRPQSLFTTAVTDGFSLDDISPRYEENINDGGGSFIQGTSAAYWAQNFTPATSHSISGVKLLLAKGFTGDPGTITVSVRATSAGAPTGSDLASGTLVGNNLTFATPQQTTALFASPVSLTAGTTYAIVISAPAATAPNTLVIAIAGRAMPGQQKYSSSDGTTWSLNGGGIWFEEYGTGSFFVTQRGRLFAEVFSLAESFIRSLSKAASEVFSVSDVFQWGQPLSASPLATDPNLIAYYKLEDLSDSSGNGHTLTNNGSVPFNTAKFGNGADQGSGNASKYLNTGSNLGVNGGAITMSFWVKLNAEITSGAWSFVNQNNTGIFVGNFVDYNFNGGTIGIRFYRFKWGVGTAEFTYNTALGTGGFHHIVYAYDGTTLKGYVDGVLVNSVAASGSGSSSSGNDFTIGASLGGGAYSSAIIDDVAVFSRALTATEVKNLYEGIFSNAFTKTLSEVFTLAESFVKTAAKPFIEAFSLAEAFVRKAFKPLAETITLAETLTALRTKVTALSDSFTISDVLLRSMGKALSEAFTLAETLVKAITRSLSDAFTIAESFTKQTGNQFAKAVSDALTISDSLLRSAGKALIDALNVSEAFASARSYFRTLTDLISLSETLAKLKTQLKVLSDSVTLSDTLAKTTTKVFTTVISISETVKKFLNGLLAIYSTKFSKRNSSFGDKYSKRSTTYGNKYSAKGSTYQDKYKHLQ